MNDQFSFMQYDNNESWENEQSFSKIISDFVWPEDCTDPEQQVEYPCYHGSSTKIHIQDEEQE